MLESRGCEIVAHKRHHHIDYAADGSVMGIEILSPRRKGVLLDGLPFRDDVARIMQAVPFRILEGAR